MTGTGWQLQSSVLSARWDVGLAIALVLLGGALGVGRRRGGPATPLHPGILFLVAALLGWSTTTWRAEARLRDRLAPSVEGQALVLHGVVRGLPQQGPDGVRFDFEPLEAPPGVPSRCRLGWWGAATPALQPGERWQFSVRLKRLHGLQNPGGFDQELQWFEQGLGAGGSVLAGRREAAATGEWVARMRAAVRARLRERVADGSTAGVLIALSIGDQAAIERADWSVFRVTGVAHLVAISGMHVTMFAWLAAAAVGGLWRRLGPAPLWCPAMVAGRWGGVLAAAGYALLAGWGVPAQRTVWMLATAAVLRSGGRQWPWPLVLGTAGVWVVLFDPWALLQPGFWLSFVAVAVLMASETATLPAVATPGRRAWQAVRTQVRISVALAPLGLLFFQQVSVIGLLANLVAIPLVSFVVTPLALGGVVWPLLWQAGAVLWQPAMAGLTWLAERPAAAWQAPLAPPGWWCLALLGIVLCALPWPRRLKWVGIAAMLPVFLQPAARPGPGEFMLWAADVGQGNAVLVRTASHDLLYDTGPQYGPRGDAGERVLVPLLRALGVGKLDLLVLSHRDMDHTGGADAVLRANGAHRLTSSLEAGHPLRSKGPHQPCAAGQRWQWDGVSFEVLHPADPAAAARSNARSCVLRIAGQGGATALLAGDIEAMQELRLVERWGAGLASDVLLVPHHGSATSSLPVFVHQVHPKWAVMQVGYRNRYRHPAAAVSQTYADAGAAIVRSDVCGAWHWSSADGSNWCVRQVQHRYWHANMTGDDPAGPLAATPDIVWP